MRIFNSIKFSDYFLKRSKMRKLLILVGGFGFNQAIPYVLGNIYFKETVIKGEWKQKQKTIVHRIFYCFILTIDVSRKYLL